MQDSPQRILIVEDEEDLAVLLRRALERHGFRVDLASENTEALEALAARQYSLLITDVYLPGKDGLRLVEAARRRWPALPVILMTGRGDRESYEQAKDLRIVAYLAKPFRISDLLAAVERGLHP